MRGHGRGASGAWVRTADGDQALSRLSRQGGSVRVLSHCNVCSVRAWDATNELVGTGEHEAWPYGGRRRGTVCESRQAQWLFLARARAWASGSGDANANANAKANVSVSASARDGGCGWLG